MEDFVLGLLAVVAVLASVLVMVVILLQEPKGGGLAAALGGSGMEAIGVNVGSVNRFTSTVAAVWIAACFLHAILMTPGPAIAAPTPNKPAPTQGLGEPGGTQLPPGDGE